MARIDLQAPTQSDLGIRVTRKDGTVEEYTAYDVVENPQDVFAIVHLTCILCNRIWLEEKSQLERSHIYCPGCGNKEEI